MSDAKQAQCVSGGRGVAALMMMTPPEVPPGGRTLVFWEDGNLTKVVDKLPTGLVDVTGTIVVYGKVKWERDGVQGCIYMRQQG